MSFRRILQENFIFVLMFLAFMVLVYMDYRYLDIQYLAFTNGDEFMQYHSLLRMFEGIQHGDIENLFRFDSYVYGFVWHLLNLAFVAPFHITNNTEMAIFMPRLLNAIFAVSCLWVVFKIARLYLGYFYSYTLVLLVLTMSGFYNSAYIFKPDVFQALLLLCSVYFLLKDNLAFHRNFYLGILFFSLSVGIAKIQAIMFLPLIYLYISMPFLAQPNMQNFKTAILRGILSSIATIAIFILTNPYILHPRGFGAWLSLFLHNMQSNATNHFSYTDVSITDKLFKVIDFYYFNIIIFALIVIFCLYYLYKSITCPNKDSAIFFPLIAAVVISFIYMFLFVNKAWENYFVSTIYLCILAFIPLFMLFPYKKLAPLLLFIQIGGGYNQSFLRQSI